MPGPLSVTVTRKRVSAICSRSTAISGSTPASSQASSELSTASLTAVSSARRGLSKPSRWRFLRKNSDTAMSRCLVAMLSAVAGPLSIRLAMIPRGRKRRHASGSRAAEQVFREPREFPSTPPSISGCCGGAMRSPSRTAALAAARSVPRRTGKSSTVQERRRASESWRFHSEAVRFTLTGDRTSGVFLPGFNFWAAHFAVLAALVSGNQNVTYVSPVLEMSTSDGGIGGYVSPVCLRIRLVEEIYHPRDEAVPTFGQFAGPYGRGWGPENQKSFRRRAPASLSGTGASVARAPNRAATATDR